MSATQKYQGTELDLFSHAVHWKNYWKRLLLPYLHGKVLEVGAGNGNNTSVFAEEGVKQWVSVEPDPELAVEIKKKNPSFKELKVITGTIQTIQEKDFDCVLYLDVLEHIRDDSGEVKEAISRLKEGGNLIVLSPSHQWLFSEFDRSIGHYRRYNRESLRKCIPKGLKEVELRYLDSVGLMASIANRFLLKKSSPSIANIRIWDSFMVPVSKMVDPLFSKIMGRSIFGVWEKKGPKIEPRF